MCQKTGAYSAYWRSKWFKYSHTVLGKECWLQRRTFLHVWSHAQVVHRRFEVLHCLQSHALIKDLNWKVLRRLQSHASIVNLADKDFVEDSPWHTLQILTERILLHTDSSKESCSNIMKGHQLAESQPGAGWTQKEALHMHAFTLKNQPKNHALGSPLAGKNESKGESPMSAFVKPA